MTKFEAIFDDIKNIDNYFYYMKYLYKYKIYGSNVSKKIKEKIKSDGEETNIDEAKNISGIFDESELKSYIDSLIPGSFAIYQKFRLSSPYFSKDDDELYAIDNPILKEKLFKVPMIKGSAWKGLLLHTAIKMLKDKTENKDIDIKNIIDTYKKIYRIFGTGSESFRNIHDIFKDYIDKNIEDTDKITQLTKELIKYALFEFGININIKKDNGESLAYKIIKLIDSKIKENKLDINIHKGNAIFYPTYFNRLALEIINPHNRKTKAGTHPIHFEVVPSNTEGYLQIIYVPFGSVFLSDEELNNQAVDDMEFIKGLICVALTDYGIGAKTKLGWGLAKLDEPKYYLNTKGGH